MRLGWSRSNALQFNTQPASVNCLCKYFCSSNNIQKFAQILKAFLLACTTSAESESEEQEQPEEEKSDLAKLLPSTDTIEAVGVQLLDALIKRGQMEMAKGAFKTQLEVLRKVQPEQVISIYLFIYLFLLRLFCLEVVCSNFILFYSAYCEQVLQAINQAIHSEIKTFKNKRFFKALEG